MNDRQTKLRQSGRTAATFLPPGTVEETGWDVLLALHSDRRCGLGLQKLGAMVSAPEAVLTAGLLRWKSASSSLARGAGRQEICSQC